MTALAFGLSIVAMVHGINYYDTVWGYHAGQAELFLAAEAERLRQDPKWDAITENTGETSVASGYK